MTDVSDRLTAALADRYRIERELGAGGMATVYLAEDLRHHRKVALKVLKSEIAATVGAGRFAREVEVAARLQHPNILPLLDSGEADGFLFYVMPYVEGESLRDRLARGGELPIHDAVRILMEVADALSEAHAQGVVHRDIKPDNVMLRGRHALVTDFGVAKAVTAATGQQLLTSTGVALGTPTYMAPEQATADPHQDHRVDIYALGVLGYELLTGRAPFSATTAQEMLAAHITAEPEPVEKFRAAVSPALAQIILKCLAKKPADRWQTAEEVLQHLEPLATPSGGTTPALTAPVLAVAGRRRIVVAAAVAAVVVLIAIGALVGQLLRPRPLSITASDLMQITNEPGVEFEPAISPDGKEVAYVAGPPDAGHVMIRSASGSAAEGGLRLSDTSFLSVAIPAWSADGDTIRFIGCRRGDCGMFEAGRLGGTMQHAALPRVADFAWPAWSPDGSRLAYFVADTLFVDTVGDTAAPRRVAVHQTRTGVPGSSTGQPFAPAWSPDGRWIAYGYGLFQWGGRSGASSIWIVRAEGGTPAAVTSSEHSNVSPVWLDQRHLLFVSDRAGAPGVFVVEVGAKGARGDPLSLPGISDPHEISYATAARKLAWMKFTIRQNIWSYPLGRSSPIPVGDGVRLTTGNEVDELGDLSTDGKWIVFSSNRSGVANLYRTPAAGGEVTPVRSATRNQFAPRWSPDGTEVAFVGEGGPTGASLSSIMVMPAGGGMPVALTRARGDNNDPAWSPDGLQLAFQSNRTGRYGVWLLSRDSVHGPWHQEVQLTDSGAYVRDYAPDGSGVLCDYGPALFVLSPQGKVVWRRDLAPFGLLWAQYARFSRDGRSVYFEGEHQDHRYGIWVIPTAGGAPRPVVLFNDPAHARPDINKLVVGRDRLYLAVEEFESDIWVAKLKY